MFFVNVIKLRPIKILALWMFIVAVIHCIREKLYQQNSCWILKFIADAIRATEVSSQLVIVINVTSYCKCYHIISNKMVVQNVGDAIYIRDKDFHSNIPYETFLDESSPSQYLTSRNSLTRP